MPSLADSHIHLFRNGFTGRYGRSPIGIGPEVDVYESLRDAHGISVALVVGYEGDGIDPTNNAYVRELAPSRAWIESVAYVPSAVAPSSADIDDLLAAGHRGIALFLDDAGSAAAVAAWPSAVWAPLEERRAIVSVNVAAAALPRLALLADAHPACAFVVAHLGDPGRHAAVPSRSVAERQLSPLVGLAAFENVHVKISGLYAVSDPAHDYPHHQATPFVDLVLAAFGPGRCLWGSDFSPSLDFVSFDQTLHPVQLNRLSDDDRARVMGLNLLELLGR